MAITLTTLDPVAELGFDEAIDVRSPAEYAEDHLPGAVNLPVLDDAERARVGTIYVQESRFLARRIGAALVARNAARHLEGYLASKPAGYRPLVYCWRGGQRSGSFATILAQIGWRVETIEGGYRSWRRMVQARLYETPFPSPVVLLDGNTGTAKTRLLELLGARGVQTLDLEGLANHRGSIFGARAGGQPSQKMFEGRLALAVSRLDPARPVVVEAESSRIGRLQVPPRVWQAMRAARRIEIVAPLAARARYLAEAYADITGDRDRLDAAIAGLAPFHDKKRIAAWHAMAEEGAFEALAAELMEHHYDPRYQRQRARLEGEIRREETPSLDEEALGALADRIAASLG
ncbi:MAG: tRNA 2-selenouridine(34) synthase MnmH [Alphaproteobacteria bacterium]|nr:MAG: tRNA 2-selenouridine(34) synthase MnmH [Alphaproteobacteria bacterium]